MVFTPTLPFDPGNLGIVGPRVLRGFQMLRIGRHTSSVFLLPQGGIWLVTGQGPGSGSNGVGKTVLLGALTLLNGDPQWRGEHGVGPYAARLLFDRRRAKISDTRFEDALRGFLIGVYLHPQRPDDAITVMMRIQKLDGRYIQVRWSEGVLLAEGLSEAERLRSAEGIWESIRASGQLGAITYAEELFGHSPRCLAYIRARGSEDNQDTGILALGQKQFRPADLAQHLIALTGQQQAVNDERRYRQQIAAEKLALDTEKANHEELLEKERQQLSDIENRAQAKRIAEEAEGQWHNFLELGATLEQLKEKAFRKKAQELRSKLDGINRKIQEKERDLSELPSLATLARKSSEDAGRAENASKKLRTIGEQIGKSKTREEHLRTIIPGLRTAAAMSLGFTAEQAQERLRAATEAEAGLRKVAGETSARVTAARDEIEQMRAGHEGAAGHVIAELAAHDIPAVRLLDLIRLDDDQRTLWEARLALYADALVVNRSHQSFDEAVFEDVLRHSPGIPVLASDQEIEPITVPPAGSSLEGALGNLVRTLDSRLTRVDDASVSDPQLGVRIWGGFELPLTDRKAVIAARLRRLEQLEREHYQAEGAVEKAAKRVEESQQVVDAVAAVRELAEAEDEHTKVTARIAELEKQYTAGEEIAGTLRDVAVRSKEAFNTHDATLKSLRQEINDLKHNGPDSRGKTTETLGEAQEQVERQELVTQRWRESLGVTELAAIVERVEAETADRLSTQRNATLREACNRLIDAIDCVVVELARPEQVAESSDKDENPFADHVAGLNMQVLELREWCKAHHAPAEANMSFRTRVKALDDWLAWFSEGDAEEEAAILSRQAARRQNIAAREHATSQTEQWLNSMRDMQIEDIGKAFREAEKQLNDLLNVAGRERVALRFSHVDVGDPHEPLRWEIYPEWIMKGGEAVEYGSSPNTAELIILHTLLAVSSMVSASDPQGRMIVIDESGNNLDGSNLRKLASILQHVAAANGLSVVLACQDVYSHLVAQHAASQLKLLRPATNDALNAKPSLLHGPEDPEVLKLFLPHLSVSESAWPQE